MRIAVWNTQQASAKRWDPLLSLRPDLAILPESTRHHARLGPSLLEPEVAWQWVGDNDAKGLALAGFGHPLNPIDPKGDPGKLSVAATAPSLDLTVLGIWSRPKPQYPYSTEIVDSLKAYDHIIQNHRTIIAGDFNLTGDGSEVEGFLGIVTHLKSRGFTSAYHHHFTEPFGVETRPTFFQGRKSDEPYHIDYLFVSDDLLPALSSVEVGGYDAWVGAGHSDHVPLTVGFR